MKLKTAGFVALTGAMFSIQAHATLDTFADQLSPNLNLEREMAKKLYVTYIDILQNTGCANGQQITANVGASGSCSAGNLELYQNLRQLEQTAEEIMQSDTSYNYSLHYTSAEMANALRAIAPEEYSAQSSLSSDFIKGQFSGLSARLTSLRLGATGFAAENSITNNTFAYDMSRPSGGGASADAKDNSDAYSRLGGFINFSSGDGKKTATNLEDAFSLDGTRVNAGLDYRLDQHLVIGALIGVSNQSLDFTKTNTNPVGKIDTDGYNIMPFVLFQADQFYMSVSVGRQSLSFDSLRVVRFPSYPDPSAPDTETTSKTDALMSTFSSEIGYSFTANKFSFEPFANVNASSTSIDGFVESDKNNQAFDLAVAGQHVKSRVYAVGANFRYTFTPSFGVVTPFVTIEQMKQAKTNQNIIEAHFVNAASATNVFQIANDSPDSSYRVLTIGVSSVLIGSHQSTDGGALAGGLQCFVNYKTVQDLQNYSLHTVEAGVRYEF